MDLITEKWIWMMNWCKSNGLAPANSDVWERAKLVWNNHHG